MREGVSKYICNQMSELDSEDVLKRVTKEIASILQNLDDAIWKIDDLESCLIYALGRLDTCIETPREMVIKEILQMKLRVVSSMEAMLNTYRDVLKVNGEL